MAVLNRPVGLLRKAVPTTVLSFVQLEGHPWACARGERQKQPSPNTTKNTTVAPFSWISRFIVLRSFPFPRGVASLESRVPEETKDLAGRCPLSDSGPHGDKFTAVTIQDDIRP